MALWQSIAEYWLASGLKSQEGVAESELQVFEEKYHLVLPDDVRKYFKTVNGTGEIMLDDYLRFWPLAEMKLVSEELTDVHSDRFDYPDCFVFADYCIWCWAYAVRLTQNPEEATPVFLIGGMQKQQIAASFREFMEQYLTNPCSIY